MSGGSMSYLFARIENEATFPTNTLERKAFMRHLQLVAKALHDIEWTDSGDYSRGDENPAIRACLNDGAILLEAVEAAKQAHEALSKELQRALEVTP